MLKGIDVSEHQGRIDWERVKGNIDFAILRAGYGRNNIDKQFVRNISECNRLGIPVGIYWFSYAWNTEMARNEAKYVLEAIKGYRVDYPISYDLEYDTLNYASKNGVTIGKRLATDMVKAFCDEINRNGYRAMNYTNQDFLLNKFYMNELTNYPLWYAWYNSKLNRDCAIWQYSESGQVPGIDGASVDMNYCYENFFENKKPKIMATTKNVDTYLNVREEGYTNAKVLGTIPAGADFEIKWVDSNYIGWYYVNYNGLEGLVSSDYVKKYDMATTKNVSSTLNVRAEGNTNSKVLGTIPAGAIFYIKWVDSDYIGWYYINYNGLEGLVSSDYVEKLDI
ncbi:SH3 domain-containing protein [Clostridium perfringens]|nr:SH3 domain-containing protein [Clostridium perfringens]